jgi:hypothetical protein
VGSTGWSAINLAARNQCYSDSARAPTENSAADIAPLIDRNIGVAIMPTSFMSALKLG